MHRLALLRSITLALAIAVSASAGWTTSSSVSTYSDIRTRWSPDGKYLLTPWGVLPGNSRTPEANAFPYRPPPINPKVTGADWSPDGRKLAVTNDAKTPTSSQALFIYDLSSPADGRSPRLLVGSDKSFRCVGPAWEPGGARIAFNHDAGDRKPNSLRIVSVKGGSPRVLIPDNVEVRHAPVWSPQGHNLLAQRYGGIVLVEADRGVFRDLALVSPEHDMPVSWFPDGVRIAYASEYHYEDGRFQPAAIRVLNLRTGLDRVIGSDPGPRGKPGHEAMFQTPACSPDGRRVAFVKHLAGEYKLLILDLKTSAISPVYRSKFSLDDPAWDPTAQKVSVWVQAETPKLLFISVPRSGRVSVKVRIPA